jgi:hypothetical protein
LEKHLVSFRGSKQIRLPLSSLQGMKKLLSLFLYVMAAIIPICAQHFMNRLKIILFFLSCLWLPVTDMVAQRSWLKKMAALNYGQWGIQRVSLYQAAAQIKN